MSRIDKKKEKKEKGEVIDRISFILVKKNVVTAGNTIIDTRFPVRMSLI